MIEDEQSMPLVLLHFLVLLLKSKNQMHGGDAPW